MEVPLRGLQSDQKNAQIEADLGREEPKEPEQPVPDSAGMQMLITTMNRETAQVLLDHFGTNIIMQIYSSNWNQR